jgi:acyl carrier protein
MGYLDRPELSAQKFIPNPFTAPSLSGSSSAGGSPGPAQNDRLYRTGDLARYLEDGNIQFLGRLDHQVKLRGFRIELGEIEAVLCQHPAIAQAAVLLRPDPQARSIDPVIAAYLVIRPEMAFDLDQIKGFLRQRVPSYMLPSVFIRIAEMPLSPGGKTDPRALLSMIPGRDEPDRPYLGPRTPIEQELADLWADLLHIQKVDVRDSFFDLGGHSLLAAQLISRIRDRYKIEIPLARLFAEPRIEALAEVITEQLIAEENPEELERLLDDIEPQPGDPQKISPSEPTQA